MHDLIEELRQYHKDKARHLFDLERGVAELLDEDALQTGIQVVRGFFEPFRCAAESAHHNNEETILIQLRQTSAPIHRRVEEISADHRAFDRIGAEIWKAINNESASRENLASRIDHFIVTYKDHAAGEDAIFFPIADEYLESVHWNRIGKAWK